MHTHVGRLAPTSLSISADLGIIRDSIRNDGRHVWTYRLRLMGQVDSSFRLLFVASHRGYDPDDFLEKEFVSWIIGIPARCVMRLGDCTARQLR